MVKALLKNRRPIRRDAIRTKGLLIKKITVAKSTFHNFETSIDRPVTPPSINPLGSKNPLIPMNAREMPSKTKKRSKIFFFIEAIT